MSAAVQLFTKVSRWLLFGGAIVLFVVTLYHAAGYISASIAVNNSGLSPDLKQAFRALWLGMSLQALITALVVLIAAFRPWSVSRPVLLICALLPGLSAALLFSFRGNLVGASLLALGALLVIAGAALRGRAPQAPAVPVPPVGAEPAGPPSALD
jgi:hypothetical protein